jgi:pimeloyl-ACP methyl ester carboxylesterase
MCDIDGRKVFAVEAGNGEPVLLLHGYPQSASCWRHQIAALADNHHVVAPDWPGFGRSDPPSTAPTYDNETDRIERLVQRLGWQRFNLCAHDYGGFVGLGYVIRHPERVLRWALLNTRAHGIFRPWFYRFSLGERWIATHPVLSAVARHLPLATLHHFALARYRKIGCSTRRSKPNIWAGWTHRKAGARFGNSSPTTRCPRSLGWRSDLRLFSARSR